MADVGGGHGYHFGSKSRARLGRESLGPSHHYRRTRSRGGNYSSGPAQDLVGYNCVVSAQIDIDGV